MDGSRYLLSTGLAPCLCRTLILKKNNALDPHSLEPIIHNPCEFIEIIGMVLRKYRNGKRFVSLRGAS